jgi:hypothetical protein
MYGRKCLGVTADNVMVTVLQLVNEAVIQGAPEYDLESDDSDDSVSDDCHELSALYQDRDYVQEVISVLQDARTDSMGLSTVVYWPDLEISEAQGK